MTRGIRLAFALGLILVFGPIVLFFYTLWLGIL